MLNAHIVWISIGTGDGVSIDGVAGDGDGDEGDGWGEVSMPTADKVVLGGGEEGLVRGWGAWDEAATHRARSG